MLVIVLTIYIFLCFFFYLPVTFSLKITYTIVVIEFDIKSLYTRWASVNMENMNSSNIISLKKDLSCAIIKNHYDLLSPEVLILSKKLDELMTPYFKNQLEYDCSTEQEE